MKVQRLIDANQLKFHYSWWDDEDKEIFDTIVDLQPTVDAVPLVHGHWETPNSYYLIKRDGLLAIEDCRCSACSSIGKLSKYCPNCGAKMDEVSE